MTEKIGEKKKSLWGVGVFTLYGGFFLFMAILVFIAVLQNFDLVEKDYYAKELTYQEQIDRMVRTDALEEKPSIKLDSRAGQIILKFPESLPIDDVSGRITLFRPSNANYDRIIKVNLDDTGEQLISTEKLIKGLWRAQVRFMMDGTDYYMEELLLID